MEVGRQKLETGSRKLEAVRQETEVWRENLRDRSRKSGAEYFQSLSRNRICGRESIKQIVAPLRRGVKPSIAPMRYSVKHKSLRHLLLLTFFMFTLNSFSQTKENTMDKTTKKTEEQWAEELSAKKYQVLRQCGTEPPFSGKYVNHKEDGNYYCAGCGTLLFSSETKYDSGSGWPSFYSVADTSNIVEITDKSHGMIRTEIKCAKCGGHLGHVFPDGPKPTGMRYCVNSASLEFGK